MKSGFLPIFLLSLASFAQGSTYVVTDPYPGSVFTCSGGVTCPPTNFTGYDVLGDSKYDAQSITINTAPSGSTTTVTITLNYNYNGQDTSLSPFSNLAGNATMTVGDLLFRSGSATGAITYGVAMTSHGLDSNGNLVDAAALNGNSALANDPLVRAGYLYAATGGTATSAQVLNGTLIPGTNDGYGNPIGSKAGDYFRGGEPVYLRGGTQDAAGTLSTVALGTANGPLVSTTISLALGSADPFLAALNSGSLFVDFNSATCGNDVVIGQLSTPEPVSISLMGGGLLMLGLYSRRRTQRS